MSSSVLMTPTPPPTSAWLCMHVYFDESKLNVDDFYLHDNDLVFIPFDYSVNFSTRLKTRPAIPIMQFFFIFVFL